MTLLKTGNLWNVAKRFKRKSKTRHVAIVCINTNLLLDMLQFKGGVVHDVRFNPDYWKPGQIELVLEHPDLPIVEDGSPLIHVDPIYEVKVNKHNRIVDMTRLEPKHMVTGKAENL